VRGVRPEQTKGLRKQGEKKERPGNPQKPQGKEKGGGERSTEKNKKLRNPRKKGMEDVETRNTVLDI